MRCKQLIISVVCAIGLLGIACGLAWVGYEVTNAIEGDTYALNTEVVEVNKTTGVVTCKDSDGNLWGFDTTGAWEVGTCAILLMNDNSTVSIHDDTVEDVLFRGQVHTHSSCTCTHQE